MKFVAHFSDKLKLGYEAEVSNDIVAQPKWDQKGI